MNNKGFTLTEVVVAMIVSSIVITCIAVYCLIGIRSFRTVRSESLSQQEADIIMMAVKDKIKTIQNYQVVDNTNYYVFEVLSGVVDADGKYQIADYAFLFDRANTNLYLVSYNDEVGYLADTEELAFQFNQSELNIEELQQTSLLSQYVTNFQVTPALIKDVGMKQTVDVSIETTVGNISINRVVTGYIRNNMSKQTKVDVGDEGEGGADDPEDPDDPDDPEEPDDD